MTPPLDPLPTTHRRLPLALVLRAESIAVQQAKQGERRPSQARVIREALSRGLDVLEAEATAPRTAA